MKSILMTLSYKNEALCTDDHESETIFGTKHSKLLRVKNCQNILLRLISYYCTTAVSNATQQG